MRRGLIRAAARPRWPRITRERGIVEGPPRRPDGEPEGVKGRGGEYRRERERVRGAEREMEAEREEIRQKGERQRGARDGNGKKDEGRGESIMKRERGGER